MTVRFEVAVRLDEEQIERQGRRLGLSLARARETVLADLECRLFDGVRHLDGVARVGVELVTGRTDMSADTHLNPVSEAVSQ